ncbi:hypothetical protein QCA50_009083 [Cerrena zonata]|uniref:GAR domain-containing protein n=1 Tax=Cerrena zonata TaxID=2478898 RepID=A0AAW0GCK3_9APHY
MFYLNNELVENVTITANRLNAGRLKGKQKSTEDLHLLAVSTHITELSYSISDIQTRIFEIQELRHKSQSGDSSDVSGVIDQSLATLDERLESVTQGIKTVNGRLEPLLNSVKTPTPLVADDAGEDALILRKHGTMLAEWEAVQKESQVLREELKEDKWLTVFRTVTEQADGMMTSLEKAVNRCQDFIYRIHKFGPDDLLSPPTPSGSTRSEKSPLTYEVFSTLIDSFEAKKKHYMPATTKVLSIIDKGVQDRVTKNGECLRRHAESTQRWKNLKERISRTDAEMEKVRKILLTSEGTPSEAGSSVSGSNNRSHNGFLATPPSEHQKMSTISRSMSPFRKLARKITKGTKSPISTPTPLKKVSSKTPSTEPTLRHRGSLFNLLGGAPPTPVTPDRPSHKYSHSLTPDSSPSLKKIESLSLAAGTSRKPAWNSSTRVEDEKGNTIRPSASRRQSVTALNRRPEDIPPVPPVGTPYRRSISRSSMASSRPWSPITSSVSTAQSSNAHTPFRPPSRAQTPGTPLSPRMRPKTPSNIPAPARNGHWRSLSTSPSDFQLDDDDRDIETSIMQRAFSPTTRAMTPSGHPPRPPSRSMIPLPSFHVSSASRPGSAMSNYRPESSMSFRSPSRLKDRESLGDGMRMTPRPTLTQTRLPPSSFKDSSPRTPISRPSSRAGAATPSQYAEGKPLHLYISSNSKDPLDTEVARVVNNIPHALLIERVDPPLRVIPKEGEEVRAQYAVANSLARKVITCKLTTLSRSGSKGVTTKKVMCRVGGGWQDLHLYILNRQAGI